MVDSVRAQIPRHISYEFVIVDGGSLDGTQQWAKDQSDVTLIEHGELRGAIPAFGEGARAAKGEYVVLANDDVIFFPYGIMTAVAHLEDNPRSGAVAFADNRAEQVGRGVGHNVDVMPAIIDGRKTNVVYAQVGMFRRELGNEVGWWGDKDRVMANARTYGGDNYLSARLWELGYTVDAVEGCRVDDQIVRDDLRTINTQRGSTDSKLYYRRFPHGPTVGSEVNGAKYARQQRLRIMVLPIYEPSFPGRLNQEYGLTEALAKVGLTWEIDYVNEDVDIVNAVKAWQPHVLITQVHGPGKITPALMSRIRDAKLDMVIVNWNGDAHESGLIAPEIMDILQYVDLQTVVNAKVLPVYKKVGIPAAYWQIGYKDPAQSWRGDTKAHDVLFLGNCYNANRYKLVDALQALKKKKLDVGIYGSCPDSVGNTHYDFAHSRALYENCTVAISDIFPDTIAFVSNRLFQALSAGAFVLQQHSPQLEKYNGLKSGIHYIEWKSLRSLKALAYEWSQPAKKKEREKIARQGMQYVRENFSYDAQVRKLWDLLP
jgi:glycosyltransferase involved in cell wall biosynthesis